MRLLQGTPREFANQTPTSHHLMKYAISTPEILPQVATLFQGNQTAFSSLLANKGLLSGSLYSEANPKTKNYKVVGNRKVMWKVKGSKLRKGRIVANGDGVTFVDPANQAEGDGTPSGYPGKNQAVVTVFLDTNWFSPKDVLELDDLRTQVSVVDDNIPREVTGGAWAYNVKLVTKDRAEYIQPALLMAGKEVGFLYTAFEELSETAYEKYTFNDWASSYMTIQRMKWSISGTAEEMNTSKVWVEHNGLKLWTEYADVEMLERWAIARENQLVFGRGTVNDKEEIILKDMENRDIIIGDGLVEQGDGSFKMPYNTLSKTVLHNTMKNMQQFANNDGVVEIAVLAGQEALWAFHDLMAKDLISSAGTAIVEGEGSAKGINLDVAYYQYSKVRFVPVWYRFFDDVARPQSYTINGKRPESGRMIFVSLGNAKFNQPNVELLAFGKRSFIRGEVNGINKGGDMANSVDGKHVHVLAETGIACHDPFGIAELYIPYKYF